MTTLKRIRRFVFLSSSLMFILVVSACTSDKAKTASDKDKQTKSAAGGAAGADRVSGDAKMPPPVGAGDDIYQPVSDVAGHARLALDVADIATLFEKSPVDYEAIKTICEKGKNSANPDGSFRTLSGFATSPDRAKEFPESAAFFGTPTFLNDEMAAALGATGVAANWSDAQRNQAITNGANRIFYHLPIHELKSSVAKFKDGNVEPVAGAPHNWDEAWAYYAGPPDQSGARPYGLASTADKLEKEYGKQGRIDQAARQAMADGLKALVRGDAAAVETANNKIISRLNAIFYLATARSLNEAYEAAAAGDSKQAATHQVEGISCYRTIQPIVAAADADADAAIKNYFTGDPGNMTEKSRDETLSALNRPRVTTELALEAGDLLTPASYSAGSRGGQ
jgi:hypothetical protein